MTALAETAEGVDGEVDVFGGERNRLDPRVDEQLAQNIEPFLTPPRQDHDRGFDQCRGAYQSDPRQTKTLFEGFPLRLLRDDRDARGSVDHHHAGRPFSSYAGISSSLRASRIGRALYRSIRASVLG